MQSPGSHTSERNSYTQHPRQQIAYPTSQPTHSGGYPPYAPAPGPSQAATPVGYVHHSLLYQQQYVVPVYGPQGPHHRPTNPGGYTSMHNPSVAPSIGGYPTGLPPPQQASNYSGQFPSGSGMHQTQVNPQVNHSSAGSDHQHPSQRYSAPSVRSLQSAPSYGQNSMTSPLGYNNVDPGPDRHSNTSERFHGAESPTGPNRTVVILSRSGEPRYVHTFPQNENVTIVMPPRDSKKHKHKSRDRKNSCHTKR